MFPVGIKAATSTYVGNYIGEKNVPMAKYFGRLAQVIGIAWSATILSVLFFFRVPILHMFSTDEKLVEVTEDLWGILLIYVFCDVNQSILQATITGVGAQSQASIITLIGYYVIGIPTSYYATFGEPDMGLTGIWVGQLAAIAFNTLAYLAYITMILDWQKMVDRAVERSFKDKKPKQVELADQTGPEDDDYKKQIN